MFALRRAVTAIGPRAAAAHKVAFLPTTFLPITPATRVATRYLNVPSWLGGDSDSDSKTLPPTISPPWTLRDLGWEAKLFEKFGPNYIDHVTEKKKELIRTRVLARKEIERSMKEQLGDDSDAWYEVMWEANRRANEFSQEVQKKFHARRKELGPVLKGKETPEQLQLAKEMRQWSLVGQREKNAEFRQQVIEERVKQKQS